jgi:hypothetical protein
MTKSALQTFETQKIIQLASDENVPEADKLRIFKESFEKLNEVTIGIINNSVYNVESSQGSTTNVKHISEFMTNADKEIFDKVKSHIETMRDQNQIKPLKITTTEEMRAAGIELDEIEIPVQFDPANFFG